MRGRRPPRSLPVSDKWNRLHADDEIALLNEEGWSVACSVSPKNGKCGGAARSRILAARTPSGESFGGHPSAQPGLSDVSDARGQRGDQAGRGMQ
jgi:hypothetical protein